MNLLKYFGYEIIYSDATNTFSANPKEISPSNYLPVCILERKKNKSISNCEVVAVGKTYTEHFYPYLDRHEIDEKTDLAMKIFNDIQQNLSFIKSRMQDTSYHGTNATSIKRLERVYSEMYEIADHPSKIYPLCVPGCFI